MSMNKYLLSGIILALVLGITLSYSTPQHIDENHTLFQVSTLSLLSVGNFDGNFSVLELKKYGDTGIGTFNSLDGEMIELDGVIYQVKSSGAIIRVSDSEMIPFAMVTKFTPDKILVINKTMNYTELENYLNTIIPSKDLVYSFKVMGSFDYIKARSPQEQNKPYPNLTDALKTQSIFNLNNINGTMVGFWCPASASSINLNDYHFHFIDAKRNSGGHVLDLKLRNVIIEIDYIPDIYLSPAQNNSFTKLI
ncbi:acetolactate decarboxylase [Methanobacterium sp. ACI-7]|uniref:acetolactate decarboxylase n=1 Tax=unclassified Methanobacterium TaxID=2627676 RepID=UPI0039C04130